MSLNRTLLKLFVLGLIFTAACTDDEALVKRDTSLDSVKVSAAATTPRACSTCKYIVPIEAMTVDGAKLGIKPGDVICLSSAI